MSMRRLFVGTLDKAQLQQEHANGVYFNAVGDSRLVCTCMYITLPGYLHREKTCIFSGRTCMLR